LTFGVSGSNQQFLVVETCNVGARLPLGNTGTVGVFYDGLVAGPEPEHVSAVPFFGAPENREKFVNFQEVPL